MERKTTFREYQFIHELFNAKQNELQHIIDNLKVNDVKEGKAFEKTKEQIKRQILLQSVRFQDPRISDHRSELQPIPEYINPFGGQRRVTIVEVEFPFEGSEELFGYRPDQLTFSDPTVYLPVGQTIKVEVLLERLDKETALREANRQFSLTKNIINAVNTQAENWSKSIEHQIDTLLEAKRKELIEFYS